MKQKIPEYKRNRTFQITKETSVNKSVEKARRQLNKLTERKKGMKTERA